MSMAACLGGKCEGLVRLVTFDGTENLVCTDCGAVKEEVSA